MRRPHRLFLGREAYRRRRMIDATRILPVLLAIIVLVPPVWLPQIFSFAAGAVWLGAGWLGIILITAVLHRTIGSTAEDDDDS